MDFHGDIEATIPALRRYAHALTGDRSAADRLVETCLDTALARRIQRHRDGPVKACLMRILLSRYRDHLRRRPVRLVAVDDPARPALRPVAADGRPALDELRAGLESLPPDQRAALLLVALDGMSLAQAAEVLSVPRGTLLALLARGRSALTRMTEPPSAAALPAATPGTAAEAPVPDESLLLYHDGTLGAAEHRALADRIDRDPAAQATLAGWRRQDGAIAALYAPVAEEGLPAQLRQLLDRPGAAPLRRPLTLPRIGALAAAGLCLALGLTLGLGFGWHARGVAFAGPPERIIADAPAFRTYHVEMIMPQ